LGSIHENKGRSKKVLMRRLFAFGSLALMLVIFSLTSGNFFSYKNIMTILLSSSITGLLALGMTFTIIAGGYDLSMGTVMTVSGVFMAQAMREWGFPIPLAILLALVVGALFGLINGFAISRMKLQPFIATLGTMMISKGLALVVSKANVLYLTDFAGFDKISTGSVIGSLIPGLNIPNAVLIFFAIALLAHWVLSKTVYGRYVFAIGSNEDAVNMSGVNADNWMTIVYITSGIFSGMAGVMMASRLVSAQPAIGSGYEMDAIAAVVIGGTPLGGGEGSMLSTVLGVFVLAVLLNGLRMLSVDQEWQTIVTGIIIIVTVYIDQRRRKQQA
jgi:ribose transport system permease protein